MSRRSIAHLPACRAASHRRLEDADLGAAAGLDSVADPAAASRRVRSRGPAPAQRAAAGGAAAHDRVLHRVAHGMRVSVFDLAPPRARSNASCSEVARRVGRSRPEILTGRRWAPAHFIFIPSVLLIGVVIGWILGTRAARDAFAMELKRREERAARKAGEADVAEAFEDLRRVVEDAAPPAAAGLGCREPDAASAGCVDPARDCRPPDRFGVQQPPPLRARAVAGRSRVPRLRPGRMGPQPAVQRRARGRDLVELWRTYNLHIARVMECAPEGERTRPRTQHTLDKTAWRKLPAGEPATLDYFMRDYVAHLAHHVAQILPGYDSLGICGFGGLVIWYLVIRVSWIDTGFAARFNHADSPKYQLTQITNSPNTNSRNITESPTHQMPVSRSHRPQRQPMRQPRRQAGGGDLRLRQRHIVRDAPEDDFAPLGVEQRRSATRASPSRGWPTDPGLIR